MLQDQHDKVSNEAFIKQRTEFFCTLSSALKAKGDAHDPTQADHNRPCRVGTY